MIAAVLHSMPLLSLVGALAAVTATHNRTKRRAAKAGMWATLSAVAWLAAVKGLHADQRLALLAPILAGAVGLLLNRPKPPKTSVLASRPGGGSHDK